MTCFAFLGPYSAHQVSFLSLAFLLVLVAAFVLVPVALAVRAGFAGRRGANNKGGGGDYARATAVSFL